MATTEQIEEKAGALATQSRQIRVTDAASYESAAEFLLAVKEYRKELAATFDPIIRKAHEAHREALAQKRRHDAPALAAESMVKGRMVDWQREEQKRAAEEARKAEAEARRQAEEEQLAAAAAAEKAGDNDVAEEIISEPVAVAPVVPRRAAPKVTGISTRKQWRFEVVDAAQIPRQYLAVDEKKIGGVVRAMKGETRIPGVRVYEAEVMSAGRR